MPVDKYSNIRSYCYRWSGECKCKIPCKYYTESIMLNASFDKSINVEKEVDEFKKKKIAERDKILNILSPSAATTAKSMNSYQIVMKEYMKPYLDYVDSTNSISKTTFPTTNEELRKYAQLSFELTPYITTIRDMSETTINNYKRYMKSLPNKYNTYYKTTGKIFSYPSTLINCPIEVFTMLNSCYKTTTVVSALSSIIWSLRTSVNNKEAGVEPLDIYIYILLQRQSFDKRQEYEVETGGKLTDKEQKNFINWETVLETRNKMEEALDVTNFSDMIDFVIIALYTYNPPTRADYANMRVFVFDEDVPTDFKDNYCIVCGPSPRFVFWKYKTASGSEPTINSIPSPLIDILLTWLEINTSNYLLVSRVGSGSGSGAGDTFTYKPMEENTLCMRIRNIFKRWTGKAASINTLRHAFISHNSRNDQIIKEKEENARRMMHSTSMADKYRRYVYEK